MVKFACDARLRLLEAGLKLFAHRGYAGTSVHDITEEAKVTKPTLYYYFENKEGLFQALVDQAMEERLRLIQEAAPPEKATVAQLIDIIEAVTGFAARKPDLLRLCFSIAFAAPGEMPSRCRRNDKTVAAYRFVREIIAAGRERGVLDDAFTTDELAQSYFHLVQHATVRAVFEAKAPRGNPPFPLPPRMEPRRMIELFLHGAKKRGKTKTAGRKTPTLPALLLAAWAGISSLQAGTTNAAPPSTNYPPAESVTPPVTSDTNVIASPGVSPELADQRTIPPVVQASHPERALVSPTAENARDPRALDLQTCFQLTAIRDDSLKISLQDIRIAQAQLSQSIAALWPTFIATNQQQFLHYIGPPKGGLSFTSFGVPVGGAGSGSGGTGGTGSGSSSSGGTATTTVSATPGNRNYESQSTVTMNYTIFDGGRNWNTVGASSALVAARRQSLARDYQTIYQSVAQAFYNVLEFDGDAAIQRDLVEALAARVEDLKGRVAIGRSRPSELLQAQTDLANARVTVEQEVGSANAARETLAFYTGIPAKNLRLKDTQKFPTVSQLEYYLQSSGGRPDILSQVESLRQAERNLSAAKGELFPTVSATGNYLASQDPVSNQIDATMTLQISMPIFDGGLILAQIHQNHEMVRQSALNVEQLRRTADQDTRTAYVNFNASASQVVVLREAAVLASRNLSAQVEDYRRGVVSNLDVLTALQDYQAARQSLHNANMTARLDLINLHVAAGMAATTPNVNNQALPAASGTAR